MPERFLKNIDRRSIFKGNINGLNYQIKLFG
jgi:hypothetical protein